jgi:hypothetical protein
MSEVGSKSPGADGAAPGDAAAARRPGGADPGAGAAGGAPPLALDAAPRPADRCAWQVVEGEAVLLDLDGRIILGLNAVASFLWPLLDGRRTVADLGDAVAARFAVAPGRARDDVTRFLVDMQGRGLIQP